MMLALVIGLVSALLLLAISRFLFDFVDDPSTTYNKSPLNDAAGPCTSLGANYNPTPSTATTSSNTSFFGCIRDQILMSLELMEMGNQDAYLFCEVVLTGRGEAITSVGNTSSLPTLETRVLMRGVINKNPTN